MVRDKIQYLAEKKNLTLQDVATLSGVSYEAIRKWNKSMPSLDKGVAVAKALKVKPEDLLKEEM